MSHICYKLKRRGGLGSTPASALVLTPDELLSFGPAASCLNAGGARGGLQGPFCADGKGRPASSLSPPPPPSLHMVRIFIEHLLCARRHPGCSGQERGFAGPMVSEYGPAWRRVNRQGTVGVGGRRHKGRERGWGQVTSEPKREGGAERPGTASAQGTFQNSPDRVIIYTQHDAPISRAQSEEFEQTAVVTVPVEPPLQAPPLAQSVTIGGPGRSGTSCPWKSRNVKLFLSGFFHAARFLTSSWRYFITNY